MTARDLESAMLARCYAVAKEGAQSANNQREANVFRLAAMVIQSRFPGESKCLRRASEQYFSLHPSERMNPADVITRGWILGLPRFRDMLSHRLNRN
jgi:hypothetical protein